MPGEINVSAKPVPGPWASPVVIPVQSAGGIEAIVAGGLSREEALAAPIFANLLAQLKQAPELEANYAAIVDGLADESLHLAERLLAASARRAIAAVEAANRPQIEGV